MLPKLASRLNVGPDGEFETVARPAERTTSENDSRDIMDGFDQSPQVAQFLCAVLTT